MSAPTACPPEDVLSLVQDGADLIVPLANGEPVTLLDTLEANAERFRGVRVHQMHALYDRPYLHGAVRDLNAQVPRTFGRNQLHVSQVAGWTIVDRPLVRGRSISQRDLPARCRAHRHRPPAVPGSAHCRGQSARVPVGGRQPMKCSERGSCSCNATA